MRLPYLLRRDRHAVFGVCLGLYSAIVFDVGRHFGPTPPTRAAIDDAVRYLDKADLELGQSRRETREWRELAAGREGSLRDAGGDPGLVMATDGKTLPNLLHASDH
jgi:hypothetical protein